MPVWVASLRSLVAEFGTGLWANFGGLDVSDVVGEIVVLVGIAKGVEGDLL